MRQIVLDTETTGISFDQGHRLIEIGCVVIENRKITNNHFHSYINPEREVEEGAFKVHGISTEFLQDKPLFKDVLNDFIAFIDGAELIIHNAAFDVSFLNGHLSLLNWHKRLEHYSTITDSLELARQKHPRQRNSLDALCKRYDIDNSNRELHGALLDAQILAAVYLAMTGGQGKLFAEEEPLVTATATEVQYELLAPIKSKLIYPTADEVASHQAFVDFLVKKSGLDHWSVVAEPAES